MTLVELAIVVVVIGVILAFMIPVLREREHAKLQAIATASPAEIFELRCYPAQEAVKDGEDSAVEINVGSDRDGNKHGAAQAAIDLLGRHLQGA